MHCPGVTSGEDREEETHRSVKPCWCVTVLSWASLLAQMVRNLPAMQKTQVQSLGREDPMEKGMVTHSSILAWRIPWTEEPSRLQSMGSQRIGHDWVIFTSLHFREIVKDWGAWHSAVHGLTKSWTWLSNWTTTSLCFSRLNILSYFKRVFLGNGFCPLVM